MECKSCKHWLCKVESHYKDGDTEEVLVRWDGGQKGMCQFGPLKGKMTEPDFGCNRYEVGGPAANITYKEGASWTHKRQGPCPDCRSAECTFPTCELLGNCRGMENCIAQRIANEGPGGRCVGTGKVFYYDDGFIGENKYKVHPKEKVKLPDKELACPNCCEEVAEKWSMCPFCGTRLKERKLAYES